MRDNFVKYKKLKLNWLLKISIKKSVPISISEKLSLQELKKLNKNMEELIKLRQQVFNNKQ